MLTAKIWGAGGRYVQTPWHNPDMGSSGLSKIGPGGQGATECRKGGAEKLDKVAGSNDSCESTGASLGDVAMEAGEGRTYSEKPRSMTCGSGTEVDIERGGGCITNPQEMLTDPQSSEPKISKEDPVQHFLK
jgi:hypothetical protein